MGQLIEGLSSRRFALGLMAALAVFAALGAFVSPLTSRFLYSSWVFLALAGALLIAVLASLVRRAPRIRSVQGFGSALLHLSLALLVAGGAYNHVACRETRLELIEGQVRPLPGGKVALRLDRLHPYYLEGRWPKGDAAEVTVLKGGAPVREALIRVNRPLALEGARVHLRLHGFAPLLDVREARGREAYRGYVSLRTILVPSVFYWRNLEIPGVPLEATCVFSPSPDGPFVRNPRLKLVVRPAGEDEVLFAGELEAGQRAAAGGHSLAFSEVRYWADFLVRRDPGLFPIYAGFWLGILGTSLALLPRVFRG